MAFPGAYDKGASDRGLSTKLWKDVNIQAVMADPRRGWFVLQDFNRGGLTFGGAVASGGIVDTTATSGTTVLATGTAGEGNILQMNSGATTVTQGENVQFPNRVQIVNGYDTYFEACVKFTGIGTGPETFIGLAAADTTIIASSLNSSTDFVGFYSITDDNVLVFATEDGGTAALETATIHTLVEDTYVKVGFKVAGAGDTAGSVNSFVNNVAIAHAVTPNCPDSTDVYPSLVCQANGTTQPIMETLWFAVAQVPS